MFIIYIIIKNKYDMKRILAFVFILGVLISCQKSEDPCIREAEVYIQSFSYDDQILHQKKFGLKLVHPGVRLQSVQTLVWRGGRSYTAQDFTWRYSFGETEGILKSTLNSSDMHYLKVEKLNVLISNRWYTIR